MLHFFKNRGATVEGTLQLLAEERQFYLDNFNINFYAKVAEFDPIKHALWTCSFDRGNPVPRLAAAIKSQAKERNILVIGDSVGRYMHCAAPTKTQVF